MHLQPVCYKVPAMLPTCGLPLSSVPYGSGPHYSSAAHEDIKSIVSLISNYVKP